MFSLYDCKEIAEQLHPTKIKQTNVGYVTTANVILMTFTPTRAYIDLYKYGPVARLIFISARNTT